MVYEAPKRYCDECGTYVGRRWGDFKIFLCPKCFREKFPDDSKPKVSTDIPY